MHESKCDRQGAVLLNDERFLRAPDQDETIEVHIIGDDHLEYKGQAIHVAPAVLALNGLLMCRREGPVSTQTIRDKVGYDASHSSFRDDMDTISETLTSLTATPEILSRPGTSRAKRYHLSDLLDFVDRQRELLRAMSREGGLLEQELGREPSPAEIADRVKVDVDVVEEVLRMMARKPLPLDYVNDDGKNDGIEYRLLQMTSQLDQISEAIESIDRQLQVDAIFDSDDMETRGKIVLSLYYGIYVPHLGGKAFAKNRIDRGDWFVYPSNEVDFLTIVREYEGSMTQMASLLKFDRGTLNELVHKTLGDARKVLLSHSRTAATVW